MWKPDGQLWHEQVVGAKCPSCSKNLRKVDTQNGGRAVRILTFSEVLTVGRFQVHRYFSCWKHMSKNKPPEYSYKNLFEEWKDWEKDKRVIIGRTISYNSDGFSTSDYEVRHIMQSGWRAPTYDTIASDFNLPNPKFLPRFDKYGIKDDFYNCDYRFLLRQIVLSPKIETLLKTRQKVLLFAAIHKTSKHTSYWPQVKIAIRHKYKIKDAGLWYDYLDLLNYFNKDLHSPKYILPANLKKEHDKYVKKKREYQRKRDLENQKKKLVQDEKNYEKVKSKFFGISFSEGDIDVSVMKSVKQIMDESDELNHCAYTNSYYSRVNSLLLSARVNGKVTETIEVCLKTFKILQARGYKNEATKFHDQIVELVNENMKSIKNVIKPLKAKKKIGASLQN